MQLLKQDTGEEQENEEIPYSDPSKDIPAAGSVTTGGKHLIHCLTIIGQVEGHYILPPQNKSTK